MPRMDYFPATSEVGAITGIRDGPEDTSGAFGCDYGEVCLKGKGVPFRTMRSLRM